MKTKGSILSRRQWRIFFVILLFLSVATLESNANAQFGGRFNVNPLRANVFIGAPREMRILVTRAQQAIQEKRFTDATAELGALLENADIEDYFILNAESDKNLTSIKTQVSNILAALPKEGQAAYALQFDAKARHLLEEAVAQGNVDLLASVERMYFHTPSGLEASMLLAHLELERGRPLAAAIRFRRLASLAAARRRFEPQLSFLLAIAWYDAGRDEEARLAVEDLHNRYATASVRVGGREIQITNAKADAIRWLADALGGPQRAMLTQAFQWAMFRGGPARNVTNIGSMPLQGFRWRTPVADNPSDEKIVRSIRAHLESESTAALPSFFPLVVNDVVLMRTPERLVAVDLKSGKRIWVFPWDESADASENESRQQTGNANYRKTRTEQLRQRFFDDAPYGQLSSDGRSVFLINDLGFATGGAPNVLVRGRGRIFSNPDRPKPHNQLVSLDLQRQGFLQWAVGGEEGEDEKLLAQAFFLGPPLPLDGKLYALAEIRDEVRLVVLNIETGRQIWSQHLAHIGDFGVMQNTTRRTAGATPSFASGVLVCPTTAGAVVGIDIDSRTLLWGFRYSSGNSTTRNGMGGIYRFQATPALGKHWADATITIADGKVLMTPVESEQLFCLDLVTGKPAWESKKREDGLFVGCVWRGIAVLAGANRLTGISIADGKQAWSLPFKGEFQPSGRGFLSEGDYFLPTSIGEIVQVKVSDGSVVQRSACNGPLGNIVCYQEQIISQGVDWLAAYFQNKPLRKLVAVRLEANPQDAWALARKGELKLYDGEKSEAITILRRAHQLQPESDSIKSLLAKTVLSALRDDFNANQKLALEVEPLLTQPGQRIEYLRLMAEGWQSNGRPFEAFQAYMELVQSPTTPLEGSGEASRLDEVDHALHIRRRRWVRAQLIELLEQSSADDLAAIRLYADEKMKLALASGSRSDLRKYLEVFAGFPGSETPRLRLAELAAGAGKRLLAELLLLEPPSADADAASPAAAAQLAALYALAARWDQAAKQYELLRDRWPEAVCLNGQTGRQLYESAKQQESVAEALAHTPFVWPRGAVKVSRSDERAVRFGNGGYAIPIELDEIGGAFPRWAHVVYEQQSRSIRLRDRHGRDLARIGLGNGQRSPSIKNYAVMHGKARGHLLVLSMGVELIAIDLLRGLQSPDDAILWRRDLSHTSPDPASSQQQRVLLQTVANPLVGATFHATDRNNRRVGVLGPVTPQGVFIQRMNEVICVDPLTGEDIWTRSGFTPGSDLFGDDELLFVAPPRGDQATVLRALDGKLLGKRPLPPYANRWRTFGRRVLSWESVDGNLNVALQDAWEESPGDWQRTFPAGSKAHIVEQTYLSVMQPNGRFFMLMLDDGGTLIDVPLEQEPSLNAIRVLSFTDQFLLLTMHPGKGVYQGMSVQKAPGREHTLGDTGRLYAFGRNDVLEKGPLNNGRVSPLWQTPAVVEEYGYPLFQPADIPLIVFLRHLTPKSKQSRGLARTTRTSVLCLDRRDGRILLQDDNIPLQVLYFSVRGDTAKNSVELKLPGKKITFEFTDQPTPPAPPAQTGAASSAVSGPTASRAGRVAGAVLKGIFSGSQKAAENAAK